MEHPFLPPLPPSPPRHGPPAGSVDCHAHVFGPLDAFPVREEASYGTFDLPVERYLDLLDGIGFARGVAVTPSAYGPDNGALLHALSRAPDRLRGVAVVGEGTTADDLADLAERGVRGLRFAHLAEARPFTGTVGYDVLAALAPAMRELDLHAQIWSSGELFVADHRELLGLGVPLVLDHMGLFDPARGTGDATFRTIVDLLADGRVWVKVVAYRLSARYPDYDDLRPFHEALLAANPDQLVWGTDWPHVRMTEQMPDDGHLVDLCMEWTGDPELQRKVLVDNPERLYRF